MRPRVWFAAFRARFFGGRARYGAGQAEYADDGMRYCIARLGPGIELVVLVGYYILAWTMKVLSLTFLLLIVIASVRSASVGAGAVTTQ